MAVRESVGSDGRSSGSGVDRWGRQQQVGSLSQLRAGTFSSTSRRRSCTSGVIRPVGRWRQASCQGAGRRAPGVWSGDRNPPVCSVGVDIGGVTLEGAVTLENVQSRDGDDRHQHPGPQCPGRRGRSGMLGIHARFADDWCWSMCSRGETTSSTSTTPRCGRDQDRGDPRGDGDRQQLLRQPRSRVLDRHVGLQHAYGVQHIPDNSGNGLFLEISAKAVVVDTVLHNE